MMVFSDGIFAMMISTVRYVVLFQLFLKCDYSNLWLYQYEKALLLNWEFPEKEEHTKTNTIGQRLTL